MWFFELIYNLQFIRFISRILQLFKAVTISHCYLLASKSSFALI